MFDEYKEASVKVEHESYEQEPISFQTVQRITYSQEPEPAHE